MAEPDIESQFDSVVAAVTDALKPLGFRKRRRTLRRANQGNWELIELQRSVASDPDRIRFTLNVGIVSKCLAEENGLDISKVGSADAHLRDRIGSFLLEPHDKWWELNAKTEADQTIEEIVGILTEKVAPYLAAHSPDTALVDLWKSDQSPGLTEAQRLRYLSILELVLASEVNARTA